MTGPSAIALYGQVARRSFLRSSTYRGATFAGAFTNTVFGFLRAYVLLAVFEHQATVGRFDAIDTVTYVFLTQGLINVVGIWGVGELGERIRSGDVVTDLYRPLDFQAYWAALDAGRAGFQIFFRTVPPLVVGALAFPLHWPGDVATLAAFAACVLLAVPLSFSYRFLLALLGFWMLDTRGVNQLGGLVMMFFSGFLVPVPFFPEGLETVARLLPFAAMLQLPIEVFLGHHRGVGAIATVLAAQALWLVALVALGRLLLHRAVRKVVVHGG